MPEDKTLLAGTARKFLAVELSFRPPVFILSFPNPRNSAAIPCFSC